MIFFFAIFLAQLVSTFEIISLSSLLKNVIHNSQEDFVVASEGNLLAFLTIELQWKPANASMQSSQLMSILIMSKVVVDRI